jgi:WD40 repeat protein
MSPPRSLSPALLVLGLLSAFSSPAAAAPPLEPLPPGARGRLGSTRFRFPYYSGDVALSPDGQVIAVRRGSESLRLLDPLTGKVRKHLKARLSGRYLSFTSDGNKLVSNAFGRITVVDLATGSQKEWTTGSGSRQVGPLQISADGKYLALGFDYSRRGEDEITVWDLTTGKQVHELSPIHTERARVVLSPDGKRAASWGYTRDRDERDKNYIFQIWDVAKEEEVGRIDTKPYGVGWATFSPDGKHLATLQGDRAIGIWDVATGKRLRRFAARRDTTHPLRYSPDGKVLVAGSREGMVQMWDLTTGGRIAVVGVPNCRLSSVALQDKGRGLAVGLKHQTLYVWELPSGKLRTPPEGHKAAVVSLGFLEGGKTLYSSGADGLYWWDVASGKPSRHRVHNPDERDALRGYSAHFLYSPDGRYLASFPDDYDSVSFLDPKDLCELFVVGNRQRSGRIPAASFSREGTFAHLRAVRGKDARRNLLTVWDLGKGVPVREVDVGHMDGVVCALSPDGGLVALADYYQRQLRKGFPPFTLGVWEVSTGRQIASLKSEEAGVRALAFAPDNQTLVAAREDGSLCLWHRGSREVLTPLEPLRLSPTSNLAFSPDGRTLALAGTEDEQQTGDGEIWVWELATGKRRTRYRGHRGLVSALAYSPDGRLLASGGADTTVLLWDRSRRPGEELSGEGKPTAKELEMLWADLNDPDPVRGHRAILRLLASPDEAITLFSRHLKLKPVRVLSEEEITRLIGDLDGDTFAKREHAMQSLAKAGKQVEASLKAALTSKPTPEQRRRLERLLKGLSKGRLGREWVRPRRAMEVLERIGSTAAGRVLERLSKERPRSWLTEEAGETLRRLQARR